MASSSVPQLVICSKSAWTPAIRREHALAAEAGRDGAEVTFLERPMDARSLLRPAERETWWRAMTGQDAAWRTPTGVRVITRSTFIPAHRSKAALTAETWLLERSLRRVPRLSGATVVATLPWHWPAVARARCRRRVLDYTDDWEALVPGAESSIRQLLRRAGDEADAITIVSRDLEPLFGDRPVTLVRNGVSRDVLDPPAQPLPASARMAYLGTLSDRFDAPLVSELLARLPAAWTLRLYGPCQYPHNADQPSDELRALLESPRASWHGVTERDRVAAVLDGADVLIVPHRRLRPGSQSGHPSWRGDVMKLYDYAARGRPIVSTTYMDDLRETGPPVLALADDAESFAAAITRAADTSSEALAAQRAWAAEHAWPQRWQAWKAATGFNVPPVRRNHTSADSGRR